MKIALIDNYDSFTYNLVQMIGELTHRPRVMRNDQLDHAYLASASHIVLSPGPGIPTEAGELIPAIHQYANSSRILGVCLGHQAIAEAFGGSLRNMTTVYHGVSTPISLHDDLLFKKLDTQIEVGRYHSWIVQKEDLPDCLEVTATDEAEEIMALRHRSLPVRGLQFHPESILTPQGLSIIQNFIDS